MLACFTGTCLLIYRLSAAFVSRIASLVAVLVFASASFSIIHGASFRADPIASLALMAALAVMACARLNLRTLLAVAGLTAVAGMITVKAALYAPAFLGVAWWRISTAANRRAATLWFVGAGAATAVCFIFLYLAQLGLLPKAATGGSAAGLGDAAGTQFGGALLPRGAEILRFVLLSPMQAILLISGFGTAMAMVRSPQSHPEAVALLGCGGVLLWVIVYRNAYPYFFPFILAPAAVMAGLAVQEIRFLRDRVLLLAFGLVAPAIIVVWTWSQRDQRAQRQVVTAVHAMFPEPVNYIDRNSMIASFPKRGFFMSTWGLQNYARTGQPVFRRLLENETIPLVIADGPALENAFGTLPELPAQLALLDADKITLRDNFIQHWGPIWIAGKVVPAKRDGAPFSIAVPGDYTIEGSAGWIDGKTVRMGQVVPLARGAHMFRPASGRQLTLRWGHHLPRPAEPFTGPIYRGF